GSRLRTGSHPEPENGWWKSDRLSERDPGPHLFLSAPTPPRPEWPLAASADVPEPRSLPQRAIPVVEANRGGCRRSRVDRVRRHTLAHRPGAGILRSPAGALGRRSLVSQGLRCPG